MSPQRISIFKGFDEIAADNVESSPMASDEPVTTPGSGSRSHIPWKSAETVVRSAEAEVKEKQCAHIF